MVRGRDNRQRDMGRGALVRSPAASTPSALVLSCSDIRSLCHMD